MVAQITGHCFDDIKSLLCSLVFRRFFKSHASLDEVFSDFNKGLRCIISTTASSNAASLPVIPAYRIDARIAAATHRRISCFKFILDLAFVIVEAIRGLVPKIQSRQHGVLLKNYGKGGRPMKNPSSPCLAPYRISATGFSGPPGNIRSSAGYPPFPAHNPF